MAHSYAFEATVDNIAYLIAEARVDELESFLGWAMSSRDFESGIARCHLDVDALRLAALAAVAYRIVGLEDLRVRPSRRVARLVALVRRGVAEIDRRRGAEVAELPGISLEKLDEVARRVRRDHRDLVEVEGEVLEREPTLSSRRTAGPVPVSTGLGGRMAARKR